MLRRSVFCLLVTLLVTGSVLAQDLEESNGELEVESFIPLAELPNHPEIRVVRAVDPLAIYSNITNFLATAFAQGPAVGGITRLVMDDVTFTTNPGVGMVGTIRFSVANLNAIPHSVRARLRFWNADGPPLGGGLPNAPGTYYGTIGFTFGVITYGVGVTTLTGTVTPFAVPAGTTTTLWAGVTFDNVGTTTGATDADLSNFGQGFFNPVNLGSSTDTIFETTAAGSFFLTNNPAGAAVNFGGTPVANQGWEFVVSVLPVELQSFGVD